MNISNETIQDFLNNLPAVLYEYVLFEDHTSEFIYMSPTAKEILEHSPEYFIEDTNHFWALVHPDDVPRLYEDDVSANKDNEFFISEVRLNLPSDKQIWVQLSSRPTSRTKNGSAIWSGYIIDITARKKAELERDSLNTSLEAAVGEIKSLQGIIPICSYCHSIRNDEGAWDKLESYISHHSEATFSHGICPKCFSKAEYDIKDEPPTE